MKKPAFEEELLRALQGQMQGPPQAAARVRVSQRLEATFVGLDLGLANLASLPSSAPVLKAAAVKASAAKAASVPLGAAKVSLATAAPALSMSTHPIATLIATFAVGAVAGTGIMVASEVVPHGKTPSALSARAPAVSSAAARPHASLRRKPQPSPAPSASALPAPAELALLAPQSENTRAVAPSDARLPRQASQSVRATPAARAAVVSSMAKTAPTTPISSRVADELGAQQSLLDRAREALARGDGERALASLSQHEQTFAATLLEEERASLKIKSLVTSGRAPEARALAADFAKRFPRSLLLPSIQAAVAQNP